MSAAETQGAGEAEILARLAEVIASRRDADPETSYVARLHHRGLDAVLKKLGEEATETIIAAKNPDRDALVGEVADLWFHAIVLLVQRDIAPAEILNELERRFGRSGVAEKAARTEEGRRSDHDTSGE